LTTGAQLQAGSAFYNTLTNIQTFTTDFTFQLTNAVADGFTFTIQNNAPTALGGLGGGLGYGADPNPNDGGNAGIGKSVAVKFDIYSNAGEGTDSTGVYLNGATPTVPAVDMTSSGVVLTSGDTMHAHITYDGTNLALTLTDTVTGKVFTDTLAVNIPSTVGANTAYVGFTGGTGGDTAVQKILTWTFTPGSGTTTTPQTPTPTFSVAGGTYASAQSVALTDAGATIYYTIDGSTPTTGSTVYSTPISVDSGTVTINAIAQISGDSASSEASATYTIQSGSTPTINFASGFPNTTGLQLNGSAKLNSSSLELTNGGGYEAGSVFWTTPVNIQAFTTNFNFQLTSAVGDGFTFAIQDAGTTALGNSGSGLGYGLDPNGGTSGGIGKRVAVKFDLHYNPNTVGIFTDGAAPSNPSTSLTSSGISLASGDTIAAQLVYNGTTLTLSLTDTVTNKTFNQAFTINIPSTVGANTAYVGFTGGTAVSTASQNIKSWTFTP
jgi:Legume lectin domain/Chitobiase/beta-hexosaminidase C-terminal domain